MSLTSEGTTVNNPGDATDYVEMLKQTSKKWRMEFKKLNRELFNKEQSTAKLYDTEVEKLFDHNKNPSVTISVDEKMQTYDKDFEEVESLLKIIESKQQELKNLNETILEVVTENVDEIWKSINLNEV